MLIDGFTPAMRLPSCLLERDLERGGRVDRGHAPRDHRRFILAQRPALVLSTLVLIDGADLDLAALVNIVGPCRVLDAHCAPVDGRATLCVLPARGSLAATAAAEALLDHHELAELA